MEQAQAVDAPPPPSPTAVEEKITYRQEEEEIRNHKVGFFISLNFHVLFPYKLSYLANVQKFKNHNGMTETVSPAREL